MRRAVQLRGTFQQALKPRFGIPAAVAAVVCAGNALFEPDPLNFGIAMGGFFAFKPALLLQVWDDCKFFFAPDFKKEREKLLAKYQPTERRP